MEISRVFLLALVTLPLFSSGMVTVTAGTGNPTEDNRNDILNLYGPAWCTCLEMLVHAAEGGKPVEDCLSQKMFAPLRERVNATMMKQVVCNKHRTWSFGGMQEKAQEQENLQANNFPIFAVGTIAPYAIGTTTAQPEIMSGETTSLAWILPLVVVSLVTVIAAGCYAWFHFNVYSKIRSFSQVQLETMR